VRRVERHTRRFDRLQRTDDGDARLRARLDFEVEMALQSRSHLELAWREARRQYEAVPRQPYRTKPIPNSPNIEIPLGALACDKIYANAIDALFTASPLLIVRANDADWTDHAKAMQRWVNWIAENEVDLRRAVENSFLDVVQLGTGCYYIPFVEEISKTDTHRIVNRGPRIISMPPENLLLPGTARDSVHDTTWAGLRFFYTPVEVRDRARRIASWNISKAMPVAAVDMTRRQREEFAKTRSSALINELFEFIDVYIRFDYDGDGIDEDLSVVWDRSSKSIIAVGYQPTDRRPIEKMVYQVRAHMPYGLGVMEMMRPLQEEATELHNFKILNSYLANVLFFFSEIGNGVSESLEIWPGKAVQVNDINKIREVRLGQAFPGMALFEEATMRLAEQRVGLQGELSMLARGGARTPATTALSLLQQVNRRFTPAFDQMRLGTAAALRQAVLRYSEHAKSGDQQVHKEITSVIGESDGELVWALLRQPDFSEAVQIEFTAASATVSRETDRQNAILLTQTMDAVHQRILELVMVAANPQTPEPLRRAVTKMIDAKNEMFDRLLRTFDLVRDPRAFIADVGPDLEQASAEAEAAAQQQQLMSALLGGLLPTPEAVPGIAAPPPGGPPGI